MNNGNDTKDVIKGSTPHAEMSLDQRQLLLRSRSGVMRGVTEAWNITSLISCLATASVSGSVILRSSAAT